MVTPTHLYHTFVGLLKLRLGGEVRHDCGTELNDTLAMLGGLVQKKVYYR